MTEYGKTENLYARDPETHRLILGEYRAEGASQIDRWLVTEKLDGTNIRILFTPGAAIDGPYGEEGLLYELEFRGRSDAATVPGKPTEKKPNAYGLFQYLTETVTPEKASALLVELQRKKGENDTDVAARLIENPVSLVIYGEGYGAGIQSGGGYGNEQRLALFDVATWVGGHSIWWSWWAVEKAAEMLDLETVPLLMRDAPTEAIVDFVRSALPSPLAMSRDDLKADPAPMEGIVARTDPYLFTQRGHRVFFKLKGHDLPTA